MEVLVSYPIFSKALAISLLSISTLFATGESPPPPYARTADDAFYNDIITTGGNAIPKPSTNNGADDTDPVDLFTQQGFILYAYLIGVHDEADCEPYFTALTTFCTERNIQKVYLFTPSPSLPNGSSKFEFFQPDSTSSPSFVSMTNDLVNQMRALPGSTNFEVAVFFEPGFFGSHATTPSFISPYTSIEAPLPSITLPGFFDYLGEMLDWAAAILPQVPGICEISFDPEGDGTDGTPANKSDQQLVFNYSDNYRFAHGLRCTHPGTTVPTIVDLSTAPGIDESSVGMANLSTFPVPTAYTGGFKPGTFPDSPPPWRQINSDLPNEADLYRPLLDYILYQAYQSNIPEIFNTPTSNGGHDFALSASRFIKLLKNEPYLNGTGVITTSKGNPIVTGCHGSNFLAFKDSDGFLFEINATKKIGIIGSVQSDTQLTLSYGPTVDLPRAKYLRTEITTGFPTQDGLTQEILDRQIFMFSVNYDTSTELNFFGNWNLSDFMGFISALPVAAKANPPFPGLNFPTLRVLYEFNLLRTIVNTEPTIPWDVAETP